MSKANVFVVSVLLLSISLVLPTSSTFGQGVKKRYLERKALKFNISEMALADIPLASRLGISYEFLLDRTYGIQLGAAYLGYPISMWGNDSLSRYWRSTTLQQGYNVDLAFRHYFDDADESSYYISTFFSTSRLWIDVNGYPSVILMKKDRAAVVIGYQKKWRSLYFDFSGGLGVKMQNWKTHLQQAPFSNQRLAPEYSGSFGWNFELNKARTTVAVPIQFLIGFRF